MKSPTIKAPGFLSDLYRDLRDRRLLPLVAVLLVAIPALPVMLRDSSKSPPPPAMPAEAALAAEEIPTLPAVLASDPGLRDYRERLDALRSKNPFAQHFALPGTKAADDAAISKVAGFGAGTDVAGALSAATGAGGGTVPEPVTETSTSSTDTTVTETTDGSTGGGGGAGDEGDDVANEQAVAYRVDVEVGRAGQLERRRNVKLLTTLPSQSNPVLLFLGASEDGKEAVFLVSEDVVRSHGAGSCLPSPDECEFLSLRMGDERRLEYAPRGEGDTFVIRLVKVRLSPIKDARELPRDDTGERRDSTRADIEAWLGL